MVKVIGVTQARVGSTRLPNKILKNYREIVDLIGEETYGKALSLAFIVLEPCSRWLRIRAGNMNPQKLSKFQVL